MFLFNVLRTAHGLPRLLCNMLGSHYWRYELRLSVVFMLRILNSRIFMLRSIESLVS